MTAHRLKTWPEYFEAIKCGDKNFEVRRNDRDFRAGDRVTLVWYDPVLKLERADTLEFVISYVLPGGQFGIEPGFAVLALALPPVTLFPDVAREAAERAAAVVDRKDAR